MILKQIFGVLEFFVLNLLLELLHIIVILPWKFLCLLFRMILQLWRQMLNVRISIKR